MKLLKNLFYKTLSGRIIKLLISIHDYIKDYDLISDTLYSDAFKIVIKEYLGVDIQKDWIGRLYAVINPNINSEGQFDITKTILEFDGTNTNNNEYLKHWIYKQLTIIGQVFSIEKLYHFINLEIKHVGPIQADNYLLVFDMVSRKLMIKNLKETLIHTTVYAIIGLILIFLVL